MKPRAGFTRASSLGHIADFVEGQGVSIARVFADADLPVGLLERPEGLLPLKDQFQLLERAARRTGDAAFGARLGTGVRIANLSAFGKHVSAADTLGAAIALASQHLAGMLQTATVLGLMHGGGRAQMTLTLLEPASEGRTQHEQLALWYMIDIVRTFAGQDWRPRFVATTALRGSTRGSLEQIYGANVAMGRHNAAISFDEVLLARAKPHNLRPAVGDPLVFSEPVVPGDRDFCGTVYAIAELALHEGIPRVDWVAGKLGMTRRTLQRRLGACGVTFAAITEAAMFARAKGMLIDERLAVTEVALRLGYQDAAHFSRAFKRWSGVPPSAYR
ncbi:MAG: AraC family transcriptional regulator ligand-binding domain-containing protein [Hyphomicrobiaceae bacterium]